MLSYLDMSLTRFGDTISLGDATGGDAASSMVFCLLWLCATRGNTVSQSDSWDVVASFDLLALLL
jgi:hypothetical protein